MVKLFNSRDHRHGADSALCFGLTVRKPEGRPLFTPFDVNERLTLWTATYIQSFQVGIRLTSKGTTKRLRIAATIFLDNSPADELLKGIKRSLAHCLGAHDDLTEFLNSTSPQELSNVIDEIERMISERCWA